ncbi:MULTISPECIES: hypothetical protein [Yersiniaceae]|jgi:hypothetical protein|uniref:hypothetical protein n=1 Tax=Rahnella sp. CG8 TaxID=2726078 RepID=UPI001A90D059|nr:MULTISPECIES: hypothetical protein [Yersiniaceae]
MEKDHLPLLEDQNLLPRGKKLPGGRRTKFALTEDIKRLSDVSGGEADVNTVPLQLGHAPATPADF